MCEKIFRALTTEMNKAKFLAKQSFDNTCFIRYLIWDISPPKENCIICGMFHVSPSLIKPDQNSAFTLVIYKLCV